METVVMVLPMRTVTRSKPPASAATALTGVPGAVAAISVSIVAVSLGPVPTLLLFMITTGAGIRCSGLWDTHPW